MKFLVDAQLPRKLTEYLKYKGLDAIHTLDLPAKNNTSDQEIIEIADAGNRIIITKDYDFYKRKLIDDVPKRLLFVITGNVSNFTLINIFDRNIDRINNLFKKNQIIEIDKDSIKVRR